MAVENIYLRCITACLQCRIVCSYPPFTLLKFWTPILDFVQPLHYFYFINSTLKTVQEKLSNREECSPLTEAPSNRRINQNKRFRILLCLPRVVEGFGNGRIRRVTTHIHRALPLFTRFTAVSPFFYQEPPQSSPRYASYCELPRKGLPPRTFHGWPLSARVRQTLRLGMNKVHDPGDSATDLTYFEVPRNLLGNAINRKFSAQALPLTSFNLEI